MPILVFKTPKKLVLGQKQAKFSSFNLQLTNNDSIFNENTPGLKHCNIYMLEISLKLIIRN
jgi:hypothetical protein